MKIVFSYSPKYSFASRAKNIDILYFYFLSNLFAREYGYKTVMFCAKEYSDLLLNIKYDEMIYLPDEESYDYPDWTENSLHKLQAISKMAEPFVYLNPTCLLFKRDILQRISNTENDTIYYSNQEIANDYLVDKSHKILKKWPDYNGFIFKNRYYNTSIFGGTDVKTMSAAANLILDFLKENAEYLDFICGDNFINLENRHTKYFANMSRMIDSVWMPQLCEQISGRKLESLITNNEIERIQRKQFDKQNEEGVYEMESPGTALSQIASRHADLITRLQSTDHIIDNKPLSIEEINKIKGFAMMKYGISF
jgi:hypothetical protein